MHTITTSPIYQRFKYQKLDPFIIQQVQKSLKWCKTFFRIDFGRCHIPEI